MRELEELMFAGRGNLFCVFRSWNHSGREESQQTRVLMIEDYAWLRAPIDTAEDLHTIEDTIKDILNEFCEGDRPPYTARVMITYWRRMEQ
jgi:hypothetical protein